MASMSYCRWHNLAHELRAAMDYVEVQASTQGGKWDCEATKREDALALMAEMLEIWGVEQSANGRLVLAERDNAELDEEEDS
jgi:hypothetical protein